MADGAAITALAGRRVLVAGASTGLGAALVAICDGRTEDWDDIFGANVLGTLRVAHAALPHLREADCGDLVIVSSTSADRVTAADYGVYASTKAAQARIADALGVELAASAPNVRVTLVKPGFMNTPGLGKGTRNREVRERIVARKERIGLPPEVVAAEIRHRLELPPEVTVPEVTILPTAK